MDNLKMKFKLHGLEFEIEGKENVVKEEFENFKSFIAGEFLSKVNVVTPLAINSPPGKTVNATPVHSATEGITDDYPAMKEVVKKDLPKTETDWILVYAFYASEFGENTFTEKDIKSYYESTGRKNQSRVNNLSNNIKSLLKQDYIKVHNDTEYLIKDEGANYARQILQGNSTSKSVKRVGGNSKKGKGKEDNESTHAVTEGKKSKGVSSSVAFVDLNLPAGELTALTSFYNSKSPKTQNEKVAVVMKWYKDHIKSNEISLEEINYLLSITSKTPSALAQVLGNMGGADFRWVTKAGGKGKYQLSSIGENYVLNKLPQDK